MQMHHFLIQNASFFNAKFIGISPEVKQVFCWGLSWSGYEAAQGVMISYLK